VIAVEYDFEEHAHGHGQNEFDYTAMADGYAVTVELPADAKAQWIVFGVSWVEGFDEQSRTNPWLVGDPCDDRLRLPTGVYEKDGSGPYGGRTIEWFLPIERPRERKDDILALFESCEVVTHTNADEGHEDVETVAEVIGPGGGEGMWLGFGGEYTLGFAGTHWHYEAYEGHYGRFKSGIGAILSGGMRVIWSHAGGGERKGTAVVEGELPSDTDGWSVLLRPDSLAHDDLLGFSAAPSATLRCGQGRGFTAGSRIARARGRSTRVGRDARGEKDGRLHCECCCLRFLRALASLCPCRPSLRFRARVSRSRVNRIDWTKLLPAETPESADIDRVNAA
jgi:hypothetical protein